MEIPAIKTFYRRREGLVELEDDVLSIVRQIRERYGDRVKVAVEPTTGQFVFSENCEDGTERLIFVSDTLDPLALERLYQADSQGRGYEDSYDKQEHEQDEEFARKDEAQLDVIRDSGERLAHALKVDGVDSPHPVTIHVPKGIHGTDDANRL